MTFNELKTKYLGQSVDVDNGFPANQPYQCTDWAQQVAREYYGFKTAPFLNKDSGYQEGGAADAFDNFGTEGNFISPSDVDLIVNDPNDSNQIPKQGDFIIFDRNTGNGMAGHIAIFDGMGDNLNYFYSLDQNAPEPKVCELFHTFTEGLGFSKVIGWLTPKKQENTAPEAVSPFSEMLLCIREYCFIYARNRGYDMSIECPEVIALTEQLHFDIAMQKQVDIIMAQKALILALQAQVANLTHKNS